MLKSGHKKIVICAPTGVGKSLVGATISKHFGRSFTVTASKHLQDQYMHSIPLLKPIKGKQNFACLKIMSDKHTEDKREAMAKGLTCDMGKCVDLETYGNETIKVVCKHKPKITDMAKSTNIDNDFNHMCDYYTQKYIALISPHSLWNYYAFFQTLKFNKQLFSEYLNRKVAIFDEAHKIEDQIIQFVGFDIFAGQLKELRIDPSRYDLTDIDSVIGLIDDISRTYAERIKEIEDSDTPDDPNDPAHSRIARMDSRRDKAIQARKDISDDKDNFVVNDPVLDLSGEFKSVSIKPVDISKFVDTFFDTEYQVFMSATIDKSSFCENMGLKPGDVAFVDTPESPFPIEHRSVKMLNVRRLNYRSTDEDERAVVNEIDRIMTEHSQHRGLILTSSIPRCHNIIKYLSPKNTRRVRMCHSMNRNNKTQDEVISEHASDPTGVLISSSLWEGVDLKDDMSRFQIIAKIPYPNYAEKRTRVKMKKFPLWYTSQTLTKMLQGLGRSIRSEDDWAKTYVLDSAISNVLYRGKQMIPHAYYDMLGTNGSNNN